MRILKQRKTAKRRNRVRHVINAERVRTRITKGDTVRVMETRPLSKQKRWRVVEIVERAR